MVDNNNKPVPQTVVFDVGGVLLDWNPRYLYRQLFAGDDDAMEYFLTHVCSHTWNLMQDAGRSFADGVGELSARYPEHAALISAYDERWPETVAGAIAGSVEILHELHRQATPLYAITNFSTEKFAYSKTQYDFLNIFLDTVVSAEVKLVKPDPAIYLTLLQKNNLQAADCVFIDDSAVNIHGARQVGMHAIHFQSPEQLRAELQGLNVLA